MPSTPRSTPEEARQLDAHMTAVDSDIDAALAHAEAAGLDPAVELEQSAYAIAARMNETGEDYRTASEAFHRERAARGITE